LSDPDSPEGEDTLSHPDHVETRDLRGIQARGSRSTPRDADAVAIAPLARDGEPGVQIGRYQLLGLVGTGGMGLVWGAWDPELERRVALKLVRYSSPNARERMLHEGQLLARLSHPNVVPVFDVGAMADQVYLVMEWIRGDTLRAHAEAAADARVVLAAYRQAGEGLAAAHRAGVIHRDFKPDNAIVGDDDRVRVLDFGIALDQTGPRHTAGAGTARYMPPEQERGDEVTAAADQYAFCVSLREGLEPHGGAPSWIAAIIARGSDPDPARRFASMDDLLGALGRDPARRRRRVGLGLVLVAFAIGAFAIGRSRAGGGEAVVEPCSGTDAELAASWNPPAHARVVANLTKLGSLTDPERVARDLDRYGAAWVDAQRTTCLANERKQLTPSLYEGRMRCLARARSQLAATGELLAGVTAADLENALVAAGSLPDTGGCAENLGIEPPRAEVRDRLREIAGRVERAVVLAVAYSPDAVAAAQGATADARATGYAPLIARARLVEGRALFANRQDPDAVYMDAIVTALQAHDDVTAVEAYARWVYVHDGPPDNWPVMVALAERLERPGRFARALLYGNRGVRRMLDGEWNEARELYDRAAKAAGDATDIELVSISQNRAELTDPDTAATLLRAAHDRLVATLGRDHRNTLSAQIKVAFTIRDPVKARAEVEQACRGLERWTNLSTVMYCAYEAAWLADQAGDRATARSWFQRVTRHPALGAVAEAYLAVTAEPPDRSALAQLAPMVTATEHSPVFERVRAADAYAVIAHVDPTSWPRALAMLDTLPHQLYRHRLAHARAHVAEQLTASRPDEARRLGDLARAWYAGAGPASGSR
jgi:hypothetical protein